MPEPGEARVEPGLRRAPQRRFLGVAFFGREGGQDRLARLRHKGAAPRDDQGVVAGLGQIGEHIPHLRRRPKIMERGQTPAIIVGNDRALRDAQQRIMRLVKRAIREIGVVGGDQRQIVAIGELDERGFAARLVRSIVAHQLDIESARKGHRQLAQQRLGGIPLPFRQQPSERPFGSARETDQPLARRSDIGEAHGRLRGPVASQIGAADQGQQVPIPGLALHQQHDPVRLYAAPRRSIASRRLVAAGERHFTADDRLHSRRRAGGGEFERAEQIPRIGDRHRRHALDLTQPHRFLDRDRPGRQRISGVNAQMNKIGERHVGNIAPPGAKFTRGRAACEQSDVFQRLARNPPGNPRRDLHV